MPFTFVHADTCHACPHGGCSEDLRSRPVRNRATRFRFKQVSAMNCTFADFMPGTDNDPDSSRTYKEYLGTFQQNALLAGPVLFGSEFDLSTSAIAKVEGDVFELLEAGALWAATAAWNRFMDSGVWDSTAFAALKGRQVRLTCRTLPYDDDAPAEPAH